VVNRQYLYLPTASGLRWQLTIHTYALTQVASVTLASLDIAGRHPFFKDSMHNIYCITAGGVYRINDDYTTTLVSNVGGIQCSNMGEYNTAPEQYLPA
jgi:hypothetical protein